MWSKDLNKKIYLFFIYLRREELDKKLWNSFKIRKIIKNHSEKNMKEKIIVIFVHQLERGKCFSLSVLYYEILSSYLYYINWEFVLIWLFVTHFNTFIENSLVSIFF